MVPPSVGVCGVVVRLMEHNNRIEDVAKWIGHRTLDTTYGTYWDVGIQELTRQMHIPWQSSTTTAPDSDCC